MHTYIHRTPQHNTQIQDTHIHRYRTQIQHRCSTEKITHRTEYRIHRTEQHRCNREQRTETNTQTHIQENTENNTQPQHRTQHRQFEYI